MPTAVVLYQFFPPDEVVSAVLFGELSAELVIRGWRVTAFPSNRDFRKNRSSYADNSNWRGVEVRRLWRPSFPQSTGSGRILNALWMIVRWSWLALHPTIRPDVMIVGTDPILSVLVALVWRRFKPRTRIVHWCFDLYPEAAVADGMLKAGSRLAAFLSFMTRRAYAACDLIVDIGSCMRTLLQRYHVNTRMETLPPWALEESHQAASIDQTERNTVFGATGLALMYSGSLGRAHSFEPVLQLARSLRKSDFKIAFSVGDDAAQVLRRVLMPEDVNVLLVPTAPPSRIATRLSAPDVCIVTLKEEWTGIVVPSKFFGALSMGRPVLFCGSRDSAVARWIDQFKLGWVLTAESAEQVAADLSRLSAHRDELEDIFRRCHRFYTEYFSKAVTVAAWEMQLRILLELPGSARGGD